MLPSSLCSRCFFLVASLTGDAGTCNYLWTVSTDPTSVTSTVFNAQNTDWMASRQTQSFLSVPREVLNIPPLNAGDVIVLRFTVTVTKNVTVGAVTDSRTASSTVLRYLQPGDIPEFGLVGPPQFPDPRR